MQAQKKEVLAYFLILEMSYLSGIGVPEWLDILPIYLIKNTM